MSRSPRLAGKSAISKTNLDFPCSKAGSAQPRKNSGNAPKKFRHPHRDQRRWVRGVKNLGVCEGSDRNNTHLECPNEFVTFRYTRTPEPTCNEAERLRMNQPRAIWETAKLSSNI